MTDTKPDRPPVVVGVDGSEQSKQALRWAAQFAACAGARVVAIAVGVPHDIRLGRNTD